MMTPNKVLPTLGLLLVSFLGFSQTVSTVSALQTALDNASAGTVITIANGTYTNADLDIQATGTAGNPIIIQAETPGGVIFENNSRIKMGGSYITLIGVKFTGSYSLSETGSNSYVIRFRNSSDCNNCKVTQVQIDDYNPSSETIDFRWIRVYGQENEISYSTFINKTCLGSMIFNQRSDGIEDKMNIHHNYFANRTLVGSVDQYNDVDVMRIGDSSESLTNSSSKVHDNYFYAVRGGEPEIIANKSGNNEYYNNTFSEYFGALSLRHGNGCSVYNNFFLNSDSTEFPSYFNGGIRIIGEDHKVYNNYIQGANASKTYPNGSPAGGLGGINISATQANNNDLSGYGPIKNLLVVNNTIVNSDYGFRIGVDSGGSGQNVAPDDIIVANNLIVNCGDYLDVDRAATNSTFEGNMFEGGGSATTGFSSQSNLLSATLVDGVYPITSSSPAVNASVGDYTVYFMDDAFAGFRSGIYDVGAQEFGATIEKGPYTQADVGVTVGFGAIEQNAGPSLNVNPFSLRYAVGGESLTFNVTSNVSWSVSDDASWLTFDTASGTDSASITATATANTTGVERTATITISENAGGNDLETSITVTQSDGTFNPDTDAAEITVVGATAVGTEPDKVAVSPNFAWDGNVTDTQYWTGDAALGEVSITFDLSCDHTLTEIGIHFLKADVRTVNFDIAISTDGGSFTTILASQDSSINTSGVNAEQLFDLGGQVARYVKFIGNSNSDDAESETLEFTSIAEVNIYGDTECNTTLGNEDFESLKAKGVTLFPVPVSNGELNIVSSKYAVNGIEVYNIAGQKVVAAKGNNQNSTQVDVSELTPGVYFIVLKEIGSAKFIVK